MATTDIGRVTPIWRGFYSAATTYELNDIVIDTAGSVWWHKSEELTTGVVPAAGEIWDAVIDMSIFSGLIQAAITTAQTALAAAQAALADVATDMERAETAAQNAENSATAASESAAGVGALAQAAAASAEAAAGSATGAAGSAQAAAGSKSDAEAYAVGKRGGEDVGSTDPTYHNNAKYYAEQAASEAEAAAQSAEDAQDVLDSIPEDYSQLSADVGDLKTQITYATGTECITIPTQNQGKYLKTVSGVIDVANPQTSGSGFGYVIVPCVPGDKFIVNGVSSSSYPMAWAFTDNAYTILTKADSNITVTNEVTIAPPNAAWMIIHDKAPYRASYSGYNIEDFDRKFSRHDEMNDNLIRYGNYTIPGSEIVQGTYRSTDGTILSSNVRIRYDGIIKLHQGDKLILKPGAIANMVLYGYRNSNTGPFYTSTGTSEEVTITANNYMEVIPAFYKNNGNAISANEYDGEIKLYNYNYNAEDIKEITRKYLSDSWNIDGDEIVQGTYNDADGGISYITSRIRVKEIIEVTFGTAIKFVPGSNCERMTIGYRAEGAETFSQLNGMWYDTESIVMLNFNGEIVIVFARSENTNISPNDYDCVCTVLNKYVTEKIPSNYPQEVGYRKSQQFTNLKWTPLARIPKAGGSFESYYFSPDYQYTGMAYSDAHTVDQRVGFDISLETFMTALNNPYSKLYTEDINANHSQSAYGLTYIGDALAGAFMGQACNLYVMYCLGSDIPYSSSEIGGWLIDNGTFERVYDQSAKGLELMDVLSKNGHVALITRLWVNKRGVVEFVQVSESISPNAKNNPIMSAEEFNTYLASNNYIILRYKDLYKNINYEQSPFVAVEDEVAETYSYNNDICTFAGDKATFKEGDLIYINYTKGAYNSMKIYKNNNLIETISLDSSASVHSVDLTNKGYTYGLYKACLTDGTAESQYTHFEIIKATASIDGNTLTFDSENATPLYYGWVNSNNYSYKKIKFTDAEISAGQVAISDTSSYYPIMKVCYQGTYGRISITAE